MKIIFQFVLMIFVMGGSWFALSKINFVEKIKI
ncbi:MAG: hypothetical protein RIQ33_1795, partial [Bacteroidota bacterium]